MGTLCCRKQPALGQNQLLIGLDNEKFRLAYPAVQKSGAAAEVAVTPVRLVRLVV